ncbi:MFS transporter [Kineococcus sp. SYSU DK003]|uniref:MFS transporter n=1 Tax=Kineococcus sp. SYSU DK003 TaxID=3383124 RepID=UPI003D7CE5D7
MVLQVAQSGSGLAAIVGTQVDWGSIGLFAVFWALMGFVQGLNPGVNRPIVAAVVPPELRGAAFALMLSVFQALGYVVFNLVAGYLGERIGLSAVMLWIPGVLMPVNGLYRTCPRHRPPRGTDAGTRRSLRCERGPAGATRHRRGRGGRPATSSARGPLASAP